MSLQFIFGSSGSGKTHILYEELIRQSVAHPERQYIVLVPEQSTLQAQKELVTYHPGHGMMNIDILSFERLAYRVFEELGVNPGVILDDLGKSMLLKKVAAAHLKELSVYGRQVSKAGFTDQMKSTLSEFYQYRMHPEQLDSLVEAAEDNPLLSCKLKDITMIFRAFEEAMDKDSITAEELLEVLAANLSRSELIKGSTIVMDGYTGFTPIQYEVISGLLQCAPKVVVTVTIDPEEEPYSKRGSYDLFYMSRSTIQKLCELAENAGIKRARDVVLPRKPVYRFKENQELAHLEERLFRYPVVAYVPKNVLKQENFAGAEEGQALNSTVAACQTVHTASIGGSGQESDHSAIYLYAASDRRGELEYVCREILRLVRDENYRYRDIAVLTKDMAGFASRAEQCFGAAGIPCFMDDTRSMLSNPLVELIRACLEVIRQDFSYESVFRYAKAGFGPLGDEDLFALENYVIALGIRGASAWNKKWERTYRGEDLINLNQINRVREVLAGPLLELRTVLKNKEATGAEKIDAVVNWLETMGGIEKLSIMGERLEAEGNLRLAREYAQIPAHIMELFERIKGLLGDEALSLDELSEILDTGFEEIRIGTIPPCIDRVTMGDLERTRLSGVKAVFLVGFNEGIIPAAEGRNGLLTEFDREQLKDLGAELAPTAKEQGFIEKFYLYLALTKPLERLYLCWAEQGDDGKAARPSAYLSVIRKLFPEVPVHRQERETGAHEENCWEAVINRDSGRKLIASGLGESKEQEPSAAWKELYSVFWADESERPEMVRLLDASFGGYREENITKAVTKVLYGQNIAGSISRLENYAACAYAQFLNYGLRLSKRQEYEFAAVDMGNLFHQALEGCFARLTAEGRSVAELSDEQRKTLVSDCVQAVAENYGNTILGSSARNIYLTSRIERITDRTLWAIGEQTKRGEMAPAEFELDFSGRQDPALKLQLDDETTMELKGRIDRVDAFEDEGSVYVRILDYKSGSESFDLNRIYRGLQLQLVVYLGAALDRERKRHPDKKIEPAGVFYFHIGDPVIDSEEPLEYEKAQSKILDKLKLDGLVLAEEKAIRLQDKEFTGKSQVIPVTEKDGVIAFEKSAVAGRQQFEQLSIHVREKMLEFGRGIAGGKIPVNPYKLKRRCACDYCDYSSVCGFDTRLPGYRYRQMRTFDDKEIWEELSKYTAEGGERHGESVDG